MCAAMSIKVRIGRSFDLRGVYNIEFIYSNGRLKENNRPDYWRYGLYHLPVSTIMILD
jgi:hypothetical protein